MRKMKNAAKLTANYCLTLNSFYPILNHTEILVNSWSDLYSSIRWNTKCFCIINAIFVGSDVQLIIFIISRSRLTDNSHFAWMWKANDTIMGWKVARQPQRIQCKGTWTLNKVCWCISVGASIILADYLHIFLIHFDLWNSGEKVFCRLG